ncbi:hypothetical protein WN51_07547 [Melipona quadrifasciata]|uniref:Uncharacterized protein n=1 Tax=Melipona quadrifasciata TaxID=166423 RepID=A0A0M9A8L3_9HYME|nr:hypothetical protein WN51_07547 [Melipona quadrifasciata]
MNSSTQTSRVIHPQGIKAVIGQNGMNKYRLQVSSHPSQRVKFRNRKATSIHFHPVWLEFSFKAIYCFYLDHITDIILPLQEANYRIITTAINHGFMGVKWTQSSVGQGCGESLRVICPALSCSGQQLTKERDHGERRAKESWLWRDGGRREKNEQSPNKNKIISTLNVQNITSSSLPQKQEKNENAKKLKETQLKESKLESSKVIGEIHGKVLNYDSVKSKLPPGVKITRLSDSSTTLSSWHNDDENVQLAIPNNLEILNANLHINLSESDSSSTSCSCSSSSTSSDTSSTSTSDISEKE